MKLLSIFLLCLSSNFLLGQCDTSNLEKFNYSELDSILKVYHVKKNHDCTCYYLEYIISKAISEKNDTIHFKCIVDLGFLYYKLGQLKKAEPFIKETITIFERDASKYEYKPDRYISAVFALGRLYYNTGRYNLAIDFILSKKEKVEYISGENHSHYISMIGDLGDAYRKLGKYQDALNYYYKTSALLAKNEGESSDNYILSNLDIAKVYRLLEDFDKSEVKYLKLQDIIAETGGKTHRLYFTIKNDLASLYFYLGKFKLAEIMYLECLEIAISTKHKKSIQVISHNLASVYSNMGYLDKAEDFELRAINSFSNEEEIIDETKGIFLNELGIIYNEKGAYIKAEESYLRALKIVEKKVGQHHVLFATIEQNLADLYDKMGKISQAKVFYTSVSDKMKNIRGRKNSYALSLTNLASFYQRQQENEKAIKIIREAHQIWDTLSQKNESNYAHSINTLAILLSKNKSINDKEEAKNLFQKAAKIKKSLFGEEHKDYIQIISNLAVLLDKMGDIQEAQKYHQEVLNLIKEPTSEVALFITRVADFYLKQKKLDDAYLYCILSIKACTDSLDITFPNLFERDSTKWAWGYKINEKLQKDDYLYLKKLNFKQSSLNSINYLLRVLQRIILLNPNAQVQTQNIESLNISKVALSINRVFWKSLYTSENQGYILNESILFIESGLNAIYNLDHKEFAEDFFYLLEQNKSVLLQDHIQKETALSFGNLPDSVIWKGVHLKNSLQDIYQKKVSFSNKQKEIDLIKEENKLLLEQAEFIQSLKDKYPDYHEIKFLETTVTLDKIQLQLSDSTILLEYFLGDTSTYAIAITKTKTKVFKIPIDKKSINRQISKMLNRGINQFLVDQKNNKASTNSTHKRYVQNAFDIYNIIVAPLLKNQDTIKKIIVIPDGKLNLLPFEALLTENVKNKNINDINYNTLSYLLDKYSLSYSYSSTLWIKNQVKKFENNNGFILGVAPFYPKSWDSTLLTMRTPSYINGLQHHQITTLEYNQKEISSIADGFQGKFLLGSEATEKKFKQDAKHYAILHLAMHGVANQENPMLSGLYFFEDKDISINDNCLYGYEISSLLLNADLVFLSACETGKGRIKQAEGVMSLVRFFMYARVPSFVASLWSLDDKVGADIATQFYNNLGQEYSKDEALREAKKAYRNQAKGDKCHPAYWASLIQIGNSDVINIKKK